MADQEIRERWSRLPQARYLFNSPYHGASPQTTEEQARRITNHITNCARERCSCDLEVYFQRLRQETEDRNSTAKKTKARTQENQEIGLSKTAKKTKAHIEDDRYSVLQKTANNTETRNDNPQDRLLSKTAKKTEARNKDNQDRVLSKTVQKTEASTDNNQDCVHLKTAKKMETHTEDDQYSMLPKTVQKTEDSIDNHQECLLSKTAKKTEATTDNPQDRLLSKTAKKTEARNKENQDRVLSKTVQKAEASTDNSQDSVLLKTAKKTGTHTENDQCLKPKTEDQDCIFVKTNQKHKMVDEDDGPQNENKKIKTGESTDTLPKTEKRSHEQRRITSQTTAKTRRRTTEREIFTNPRSKKTPTSTATTAMIGSQRRNILRFHEDTRDWAQLDEKCSGALDASHRIDSTDPRSYGLITQELQDLRSGQIGSEVIHRYFTLLSASSVHIRVEHFHPAYTPLMAGLLPPPQVVNPHEKFEDRHLLCDWLLCPFVHAGHISFVTVEYETYTLIHEDSLCGIHNSAQLFDGIEKFFRDHIVYRQLRGLPLRPGFRPETIWTRVEATITTTAQQTDGISCGIKTCGNATCRIQGMAGFSFTQAYNPQMRLQIYHCIMRNVLFPITLMAETESSRAELSRTTTWYERNRVSYSAILRHRRSRPLPQLTLVGQGTIAEPFEIDTEDRNTRSTHTNITVNLLDDD